MLSAVSGAGDLKPHLVDGFKLCTDPQFVAKVVDVVGLYHNPPERAVVLCVDEKGSVQALDRSQPPGRGERRAAARRQSRVSASRTTSASASRSRGG
jgi:hypothetical protein